MYTREGCVAGEETSRGPGGVSGADWLLESFNSARTGDHPVAPPMPILSIFKFFKFFLETRSCYNSEALSVFTVLTTDRSVVVESWTIIHD